MDRLKRWFGEEEESPARVAVSVQPPATSVEAEVIPAAEAGPRLITMYREGTPVEVPISEIPKFESLGFLLHKPEDLVALAREIGQYSNVLYPCLMRLVDALTEDGCIDPSERGDFHVLQKTHNLIGERLQTFINVIFQNYPVKE